MNQKRILGLLLLITLFTGLSIYAHWPVAPLPAGLKADKVLLEKSLRRLTLFKEGHPVAIYNVSLGRSPEVHKIQEGDNKTPEGLYTIDFHKPNSAYHMALHISYPEKKDLTAKNPGGDIMIHGLHNYLGIMGRLHLLADWTRGCIAVTNDEIEQIYAAVPDGTVIEIKP